MKLFYGTGNQSKLRNMRAILAGMPIELVTPADLGIQLPAVEETGATPLENAALKAEAYHAVSGLPSFSLVPQNDKSILLINAGMTPMKPWFKGEQIPPRKRVCTCQKCIRTGDIENVGHISSWRTSTAAG